MLQRARVVLLKARQVSTMPVVADLLLAADVLSM